MTAHPVLVSPSSDLLRHVLHDSPETRIALVSTIRHAHARHDLDRLGEQLTARHVAHRQWRAIGNERIVTATGLTVTIMSPRPDSWRGLSFDRLVHADLRRPSDEFLDAVAPSFLVPHKHANLDAAFGCHVCQARMRGAE
ncbi:hypothetical protein CWIS_09685 [Cellulomonas sp. A375-1]|uniref:hypothetical protein n=1 Tax=Cellulomonas sp. A375-1 TaxID=1672219 RepID=UPI00065D6273|nr:hypothetical protein [Cellulomonas sp. A375-1]KMM45602.1 hypothetical protein CWIS_09685 [Cellulomonas sp. A375-1]